MKITWTAKSGIESGYSCRKIRNPNYPDIFCNTELQNFASTSRITLMVKRLFGTVWDFWGFLETFRTLGDLEGLLWTACGLLVDPLWTPCGPLVDFFWTSGRLLGDFPGTPYGLLVG